jgi:hypothetical protein
MTTFLFAVELRGEGDTREEAWRNATEAFSCDPGSCPENAIIEEEDVNVGRT